jgi:hypothetical protein
MRRSSTGVYSLNFVGGRTARRLQTWWEQIAIQSWGLVRQIPLINSLVKQLWARAAHAPHRPEQPQRAESGPASGARLTEWTDDRWHGCCGAWLTTCGGRTGLDLAPSPHDTAGAKASSPGPGCGASGACVATTRRYSGNLAGLDGADRLCQAEYPGSHFYRESCDSRRKRNDAFGYAELELGPCWSCADWTSDSSGNYLAAGEKCPTGYAAVGAVIPTSMCLDPTGLGQCWRICEAGDQPLVSGRMIGPCHGRGIVAWHRTCALAFASC